MPSEVRYVIFSKEELLVAVQSYFQRVGEKFPEGTIEKILPIYDEVLSVLMEIGGRRHKFNDGLIFRALLLACKSGRVPLPKMATKQLQVVDDNVALVITKGVNIQRVRLHITAPEVTVG